MKMKDVKAAIVPHKGANLSATWVRPLKTRKGVTSEVVKLTCAVIRGGIDYDNMKAVQEGRADGTLPAENAGLPWGEWVQFPIHIAHKGVDYVRLYPSSGIDCHPKSTFFVDGVETPKETVEALCLASEFRHDVEAPQCFTIKAENLVSINGIG